MGKDTKKQLMKAETLYKAMQYKKAARLFNSLGNTFLNNSNYDLARDCFSNAAMCLINEEKYSLGLKFFRNAGNSSLFKNNYLEAQNFFKDALKYVTKVRNNTERNFYYIIFSSLSYLCSFVTGKQEEGLNIIKRIKNYVDDNYFKENPLIRLIKDITIAIKDKNAKYLEKIEKEFDQSKFLKGELNLVKQSLIIVKTHVSLIIMMNIDKKEYTTNDIINLMIKIDSKPLLDSLKHPFYNYELKELKISKIALNLSDNFTSKKKPEIPFFIKAGHLHQLDFQIKPHFQMENPFIGPLTLTSEIDGNLLLFYEIPEVIIPNLKSPLPTLDVSIKELRPPLIGKSFPLEILIENKSEGDASQVSINIKLPKELKLIRGTLKKQIHSLTQSENITWEINLKPLEAGDYIIEFDIEFYDPDGNKYEEIKKFPLAIKL